MVCMTCSLHLKIYVNLKIATIGCCGVKYWKLLRLSVLPAEAQCFAGVCKCLNPGLAYISRGNVDSMYLNYSNPEQGLGQHSSFEGCEYEKQLQSFLSSPAQTQPSFLPVQPSQMLLAPASSQILPPPLDPFPALAQVGTNLSRKLQVPAVRYPLPNRSMGLFDR